MSFSAGVVWERRPRGRRAALLTAVSAAVALGMAITTPPRSGSFCSGDCITAPYTDAADFVPRDYLWMYAACLMLASFVVLVALWVLFPLYGCYTALTDGVSRAWVADLVNYLDYMAEPDKNKRISLGIMVLIYLGVLFAFAYSLKRTYWKDVH